MPPNRADPRARPRAPRAPRVFLRTIARLTRIAVEEGYGDSQTRRTLNYHLHTVGGLNGPADFVDPKFVPDFEGDVAWFEMEKVERGGEHRWPWWRAVRQVEPPADA
ncbi:hypothetical protein SGCZBJ_20300 [Caulobacter zeae]|uniref:Uncharacterized protein n=1 Tax=Caulobacter zeae TaxID=2055137 RepID=A0A2N5D781_9CAUL|nr:hypothetical protein [Caulobacter zeae]PLR21911.1 hypothetical protein SGCZBJ_20300 [Caulobacter zeae]